MQKFKFLYCNNAFENNEADPVYDGEYRVSREKGFENSLFSYEDLEFGKLRLFNGNIEGSTIYRGWMMKPDMYQKFYEKLKNKGIELINTPNEYNKYHLLPGWYKDFEDCTAKSSWTEDFSEESLKELLSKFEGAVIVKDYVKSRKHEWYEACFIEDVKDTENALKVIKNFIERQDDLLTGGVVLREFLNLKSIGKHENSGMPISEEYRVFVLDNEPLIIDSYWHHSEGGLSDNEIKWVKEICKRIDSRFVTIDLARKSDGELVVMELGDGQVSGLQDIPEDEFYKCF